MILSCNKISKSFGDNKILENISFQIQNGDKIAIVGINGAGKSTLLKIILGQIDYDEGSIYLDKSIDNIGYLSQIIDLDENKTMYECFLEIFWDIIDLQNNIKNIEDKMKISPSKELEDLIKKYSEYTTKLENKQAYSYESKIRGVIKGLKFEPEDANIKIHKLSGGQKSRVMLGKLLLMEPKILLLDEPTNHLDIDSIIWLEQYLKSYQNTLILISHDRYFINKVSTKIFEIQNKKLTIYSCTYEEYTKQKEENREIQLKNYIQQQKDIEIQKDKIQLLKSFNREKSIKRALSKEKMLSKIELLDEPENVQRKIKISINPKTISGTDILDAIEISKEFDDIKIFEKINFSIKKGDKIALIGPNGVGKTTLLNIILENIEQTEGKIKKGSNVKIGYYDQEHKNLQLKKSILDNILDEFPNINISDIRLTLANFLFFEDDVFKTVENLSGGEKGRLSLVKLMLGDFNFLILDEPTNHLDLNSKEILEVALAQYTGTIFFVSHDRYFINNICNKIFELSKQNIEVYLGNYDYYLEKKNFVQKKEDNAIKITKNKWIKSKEDKYKEKKIKLDLKKIENEIQKIEDEIQILQKKLEDQTIATNSSKANDIYNQKCKLEENLVDLYQKWDDLQNI